MNRLGRLSITAVLFTLCATFAVAAPRERGSLAEKLELNLEQQTQFLELRQAFRDSSRELFTAAHETRREYRAARRAGDSAKMQELRPQVDAQREQIKQLRDEHRRKILELLTPEQQAKFEELQRGRRERRGGRFID